LSRLPNAHKTIIDLKKVREYLLSPSHPDGRYKAAFFRNFGYDASDNSQLRNDFQKLILSHDAIQEAASSYGKKYLVQGKITGPSGETFNISTFWIILEGEEVPRFITVYSGGKK
jgi:hypothetical protein